MGGIGLVACQDFLVGGDCACILVVGTGSLLSGVSSSEFWGVYGFAMDFGSLSFSAELCFCFAGELVWYVLHWHLLALGWSLVSV